MTGQRRRTYRELQADATRDDVTPPVLPERTPAERDARIADLAPRWAKIVDGLLERIDGFERVNFIDPMRLVDATGDTLFLEAPAPWIGWVRLRYAPAIAQIVERLAGRPIAIEVVARLGELDDASRPAAAPDDASSPTSDATHTVADDQVRPGTPLGGEGPGPRDDDTNAAGEDR